MTNRAKAIEQFFSEALGFLMLYKAFLSFEAEDKIPHYWYTNVGVTATIFQKEIWEIF